MWSSREKMGPWNTGSSGQVCKRRLCLGTPADDTYRQVRWEQRLQEDSPGWDRHLGILRPTCMGTKALFLCPWNLEHLFPGSWGTPSCKAELPAFPVTWDGTLLMTAARGVYTGRVLGAPATLKAQGGAWASLPHGPPASWLSDSQECPALNKRTRRMSRHTSLHCTLLHCVFFTN